MPRTIRQVGAWAVKEFAIAYQTRSGLIALPHRLGMEHRKPKAISYKLNPARQARNFTYNALAFLRLAAIRMMLRRLGNP